MIVSALLTSVGINLGLCILFFTLYSILRKQPGNINVYAPRLVAEGKSKQTSHFDLERLLPSPGWVRRAWQPSEEELLSISGLDVVVFMHIFTFSLKVFSLAGVVGIFILLPINYLGSRLNEIDISNIPNKSLDLFSISNVEDGSKRLWIHFCAIYFFTGAVCYLLYYSDAKKLFRRLSYLKSNGSSQQKFRRSGFLGLFGPKVDIVTHYEKQLEDLEENVRMEQSDVLLSGQEVAAAFVSFKSRYGAAIAFHFQQSNNPIEWVTEQAPEPNNIYWPFFSASFMKRWISKLVVIVVSTVLTLLFLIPVFVVQGLTNLKQLIIYFPFLEGVLTITFVSQVVTGYLPSLILQLFLSMVPPIMKILSSMQGYISHSEIEKSACYKVLWFTIWNIFFANVVSGSIFSLFNIFLEPKQIPTKLAVAVPAQASFFISYVVTSGWTSLSSELFRMTPLLWNFIKGCAGHGDDELHVPYIPYHNEIPRILFFGLLGTTYFFLAPLILPFLLAYFCLGYIIYRNQLLNVYAPKYDTGGQFWPIVHNSMVFSLILMQFIAVGIFGLKKLPVASILVVPLIVFTVLFNEYCRKRFLPMFKAYSAETLIKKDREDQNDPAMDHFLDELLNAYKDPVLMPIQFSENDNGHNAPLLG